MMCILVSLLLCLLFMSGGVLNQGLKEDANMSSCIEEERQALLDVKADLTDPFGNLTDWGSEGEKSDCCKWVGVTCNNLTGHVIELDLTFSPSGFTDKISLSLQVLNQLQYLNLSGINFQSNPLPNNLGSMSKLQFLDISNANLSGPIPFTFGDLTSLTYLDLSQNQLAGDIPKSLGNCSSLVHLDLSQNLLNGSIPDSIGQLSNLRVLDFSSNSLEGVISEVHFLNLTQLDYLDLSFNSLALDLNFHERIPFQLSTIKLQSCKLGPGFPMWIRTQRDFKHLDISSAGISDSAPAWFWDLPTGLVFLNISSTQIKGSVLSSESLTSEEDHFLDNALVKWKGKERSFERIGLQLLKSIDLSRNNFSGVLPYEITSLYDVASLNLSNNKLYGEVPKDIGLLKSLQSLDLSRNEFSGHIPWSLAQINSLGYLDLSNNNLSERIPTGTQLQSFNYTSYSGNPQLCGPPLTQRCGFPPVVEKKDVEDEEDDFWKSYYIGMSAGFALGFFGICSALVLSRHCRYLFFTSLSHMKDWIYVTVVVYFG